MVFTETQNTSSYCKNNSSFRNKYKNTNVSFDVIDHNFPPPYMVNSPELIANDKSLPNVYTRCHISGAILYLREYYIYCCNGES